jgi:hypothetical protein
VSWGLTEGIILLPISFVRLSVRCQSQVGDGFVTLMALGVPTVFRVVRYSDEQDGLTKLMDALDLLTQT